MPPPTATSSRSLLIARAQRCFRCMLDDVGGIKALYLDKETSGFISVLWGQVELLEADVFYVGLIGQPREFCNGLAYMKAVYFVRPTSENVMKLMNELKSPRFAQYYIYFSAPLDNKKLERLAKADVDERACVIQQFYVDIEIINPCVFTLNVPNTAHLLCEPSTLWSSQQHVLFQRITHGLLSGLLCSLRHPFKGVLFSAQSSISRNLVESLYETINDNALTQCLSADPLPGEQKSTLGTLVLIVDRRDDCVTPLLNQWRYQAMVHELIGLQKNRVLLPKHEALPLSSTPPVTGTTQESTEVVLSCHTDPFFAEHWKSDFGELGVAINAYVQKYKTESEALGGSSLENLKNIASKYPELRQRSTNVSKHVHLLHILSKHVETKGLLEVSRLEQDLASHQRTPAEHLQPVLEHLRHPHMEPSQKLRLALLYVLRYRNDKPSVVMIREALHTANVPKPYLLDALLAYTASYCKNVERRVGSNNLFDLARNVVQRGFKQSSNVYTQHRSFVFSLVETAIKNETWDIPGFTFLPFSASDANVCTSEPAQCSKFYTEKKNGRQFPDLVVFILGGATFQETVDLDDIAAQYNCSIVVGGTTLHNTASFLNDVSQFAQGYGVSLENFDVNQTCKTPSAVGDNSLGLVPANTYTSVPITSESLSPRATDLETKKNFLREKW